MKKFFTLVTVVCLLTVGATRANANGICSGGVVFGQQIIVSNPLPVIVQPTNAFLFAGSFGVSTPFAFSGGFAVNRAFVGGFASRQVFVGNNFAHGGAIAGGGFGNRGAIVRQRTVVRVR